MKRLTKIKVGLGIVIILLFGLGVYLMIPIYEDLIIKLGTPIMQER